MALHTWNQAIDAQPGHGWAALLVGAVYAVSILIVCCVVKGDLLPVLWPRPRALLKVLQQASSTALSCCPRGLGHCQPDSAGLDLPINLRLLDIHAKAGRVQPCKGSTGQKAICTL